MRKVWTLLVFLLLSSAVATADENPLRLTAFGDSLVQGYGLPQDEGFVPQLQEWLSRQGIAAQITNAGVSGDTTAGGAARLGWTLGDNPEGLIVLFGGNDLLRGVQPNVAEENLRKIMRQARQEQVEVLLIGMKAPGNFGPAYKEAFDRIYPDLAAEYEAIFHPDAFTGIRDVVGEDPAAARPYMQDDNIHPNAEGVQLNIAALGPRVLDLIARIERER